MSNDIFRKIKDNITAVQVLERYVGNPDKVSKWKSPFRVEKTASVTVKGEVINDHGSDFKGDCVSFVAKLYNLKKIEAAEMIANDFGISRENLSNQKIKKLQQQREQQRIEEEKIRHEFNQLFQELCDIFHFCKNPGLEEMLNKMIDCCRDAAKMKEINRKVNIWKYGN